MVRLEVLRLLPLPLLFWSFPPLCLFPCVICHPQWVQVLSGRLCRLPFAVTYLAATPIVSAAPFVPPLDVTPSESSCKHCREDYSSAECLEMLGELEKVWAACKQSSYCSLDHQGPSSASSAPASTASSATPSHSSHPSEPASGAGTCPSTLSGSSPSSPSAASSWSPARNRSRPVTRLLSSERLLLGRHRFRPLPATGTGLDPVTHLPVSLQLRLPPGPLHLPGPAQPAHCLPVHVRVSRALGRLLRGICVTILLLVRSRAVSDSLIRHWP